MYYQVFNDWEINYTDTMGRALIYAIDEQTGDARPVCNLPGCAHDSDTCPAWSDGNVTLCYGDGDEVYLLVFHYNELLLLGTNQRQPHRTHFAGGCGAGPVRRGPRRGRGR